MKTQLLLSFAFLYYTLGLAHNPNEAFFTYTLKENTVEVEAELPWSMRSALIKFKPELEHASSKKDFEATFKVYIDENLILKDRHGHRLPFQQFYELENLGHSHQSHYIIIFKGKELYEITNTFMFNLYENQVNYNSLIIDNKTTTFKTQKNSPQFLLEEQHHTTYWYLLILIVPVMYLIKTLKHSYHNAF